MTEKEIKDWYAKRVPLSGRISDYAILVGQNNQALQSIPTLGATGVAVTLPPRQNRVAVAVLADVTLQTAAMKADFRFRDANGNTLISHTVFLKLIDTGAATPSPFTYNPLLCTVVDYGPIIQQQLFGSAQTGLIWSIVEVLMNPKCCEYIGGSK